MVILIKDSVSAKASSTPYLVLHHSDLKDRLKHFNTIHKAYKNGNLDAMHFDFYLGRTYQMKFGKYPIWDKAAYKPEEKIEWLIEEQNID